MSANTKIEWAHHTFNGWWGCTKISPGCANCYADTFSKRTGHHVWGANAPRRFFAEPHWKEPLKWDRLAAEAGERHRVFCGSMMDIGEDRPDLVEPRKRICDLVERTPHLDWLLLSKRPENHTRLMTWGEGVWPRNAWAMTTVENQKTANARIPELLKVKAVVRGLSMEPLLEGVDLSEWIKPWLTCGACGDVYELSEAIPDPEGHPHGADKCAKCGREWHMLSLWGDEQVSRFESGERYANNGPHPEDDGCLINWVIVGGESGHGARPFAIKWARSIVAQCKAAGVACFVKQLGTVPAFTTIPEASEPWVGERLRLNVPMPFFGRLKLNDAKGGDMAEWPEDLRVRELPEVARG